VPTELETYDDAVFLLPGESKREFEIIRRMIIENIHPHTNMEWLWVIDLCELSWEIQRYRRLKEEILQTGRIDAIVSILQRLDGAGMPAECSTNVQTRSQRAGVDWRENPEAASEIEARLERFGFDLSAINAEVFVQAQEAFGLFDRMMQSAQHRRINLLREIAIRRQFQTLHGKKLKPLT
jgi:hypothetical protein